MLAVAWPYHDCTLSSICLLGLVGMLAATTQKQNIKMTISFLRISDTRIHDVRANQKQPWLGRSLSQLSYSREEGFRLHAIYINMNIREMLHIKGAVPLDE